MNCPRCHAALAAAPEEAGFVICASCGARLKRAAAASRLPVPVAASIAGRPAPAEPVPPVAAVEPRAAEIDSILARLEPIANPAATLPPGTPLKAIPRPESREHLKPIADALQALVSEVRALRSSQEQILALLKARPPSPEPRPDRDFGETDGDSDLDDPAPAPPARSRHRKTVLVIDDDESALKPLVEVLERAEIPVRVARDGSAGLAMIAQDKPDIIVLELGMAGVMSGKDVINMIKATMEWVDIPIVLYTRFPVASQKEARTVHGADEFVPKDSANPADALVAKVITLFRKG